MVKYCRVKYSEVELDRRYVESSRVKYSYVVVMYRVQQSEVELWSMIVESSRVK